MPKAINAQIQVLERMLLMSASAIDAEAIEFDIVSEVSIEAEPLDVLFGSDSDDTLFGSERDDTIIALDGDDWIQAGAGADVIDGGEGQDRIAHWDSAEAVFIDLQNQTVSGGSAEGDTITSIEQAVGSNNDDVIIGSDGNNGFLRGGGGNDVIDGLGGNDHIRGDGGDDIINGGDGNDWIQAGAGADVIDGGEGQDRIAHWDSAEAVFIDLQNQTVSGGSAEGDTITSIEQAVGSNNDDVIIGSDGNNGFLRGGGGNDVIDGLGGNDHIQGDGGDDIINGGDGNDWIQAGAGSDVIDGGAGQDTAQFRGNASEYRVVQVGDEIHVEHLHSGDIDVLTGIESLRFDGITLSVESLGMMTETDAIEVEVGAAQETQLALVLPTVEGMDHSQMTVTISGVPAEAMLTEGTQNPDGTWTLSGEDFQAASLRTPTAFSGEITLEVAVQGAVQLTELASVQVQKSQSVTMTVTPSDAPNNYIANGSFEDVTGMTEVRYGHRGQDIAGWNLDDGPQFELTDNRHGVDQAVDGGYWLDMDASPGNITISQDVLGLEDGKVYQLEFSTANSNPFTHRGELLDTTSNGMAVYWNGENIANVTSEDAEWSLHQLDVRAGSGDGSNTLTFKGLGQEDNVGISLDNIRMSDSDNLLVNGSFENLTGLTKAGFGYHGDAVQGWTLESAGTIIANENFEGGAEGWTDNTTTESGNDQLTEFLGRFGGSDGEQIVSKTFDLSEDANIAVVEFDFLKLDSWDSNVHFADDGGNEAFQIFLNNENVLSFTPEGATTRGAEQQGLDGASGQNGNVKYTITSSGQDEAMFGPNPNGNWLERSYHVRLEIVDPGSELTVGFGSTLDQQIRDESFGIDNVLIFEADAPGTVMNPDGSLTAEGNRFEAHNPRGGVEASDGDYWMDMGGTAGNATISQQIPGVVNGQSYQLSFDLADSHRDATDGLDVIWNGEVIASISQQDASMNRFEFTVEGGSGDESNTLMFRGTGNINNFGVSLDNVSMTELSEVDSQQHNYVTNGSFEDLSGLTKAGFGHHGQELTGWNLDDGPRFEVHVPRHGVDQASDGEYWLDLDASPGNVTVSQSIEGLSQGEVYDLSFNVANSNPFVHRGELLDTASNGVAVFWNGQQIGEITQVGSEWEAQGLTIVSGTGDGTDRLTFQGLGASDNVGLSLDDIRIVDSNLVTQAVDGAFEDYDVQVNDNLVSLTHKTNGEKLTLHDVDVLRFNNGGGFFGVSGASGSGGQGSLYSLSGGLGRGAAESAPNDPISDDGEPQPNPEVQHENGPVNPGPPGPPALPAFGPPPPPMI